MATPDEPSANTNEPTREGAIQGREALRAAIAGLMQEATREIRLYAPRLDATIFNYSIVVDALRQFAVRHTNNRALFLIEDGASLQENQRLLALIRRLNDRVALHEVGEEDRGGADLYLVIDHALHLHQGDVLRSDALIVRQKPHDTMHIVDRFDTAWHRSSSVRLNSVGL